MNDPPLAIRRSARRLRFITLALIVLYEVGVALGTWILLTGRQAGLSWVEVHDRGISPWPAALTLIALGILIGLALYRLARLLRRIEQGAVFGVARDLRGFAFYIFMGVVATVVMPPVLTLLLDGGRSAAFRFGSSEAITLLLTGLLFLVAKVLDEAQQLAEDHSQIV